ncbi:UNVERIFIED_CONTAM: hypothetical protein HDU68_003135, partial [Siphonaria sp. JEL0065]
FYLDDNSALTQFIKSIQLPLTAADLAPFTGSFPAIPAGGASVNGVISPGTGAPVTTTKSAGVSVSASLVAAAFSALRFE